MGTSASTARQTQRTNERAYIRSLGQRYPLGDAELRKWVYCVDSNGSSPVLTDSNSALATLAVMSASYGDYNPYIRSTSQQQPSRNPNYYYFNNPFTQRTNAAVKVLKAISIVEKEIFPEGLSSKIAHFALKIPKRSPHDTTTTKWDPPIGPSTTKEEISTMEESFYSISSRVEKFIKLSTSAPSASSYGSSNYNNSATTYNDDGDDTLEQFLEGISISCGRRGSRACLSKLFSIASLSLENGNSVTGGSSSMQQQQQQAEASDIIYTSYCLTLAASYLRSVAEKNDNNVDGGVEGLGDWTSYVPQQDPTHMQSMVDSLLEFAKKQRQDGIGGGSVGSNTAYYDYSYPTASATTASASGPMTNKSSNASDTSVSLEQFLEWTETTAPMMGSALPTFLHVLFSFFSTTAASSSSSDQHSVSGSTSNKDFEKEPRFPPGVTPIFIPTFTIDKPPSNSKTGIPSPISSSFFHEPHSSSFDLFALACTSLSVASGRWHRLFSSEANGLSCNRLMHSILGFGGPTLLLIRSKDSVKDGKCGIGVFGAYSFTPWSEESGGYYGNSDCFLFRLGPEPMGVYRPVGGGESVGSLGDAGNSSKSNENSDTRNFMYFNPEARSKGYDGLAHGIGFGGTAEAPRLFIDEVLDGCRASSDDLTFQNGPLLSGVDPKSNSSHFEVEAMEVWGVGSSMQIEEALLARDGQRMDAEKRIRQAMKGAKGQFLEDFQSGLAGSKMFQHRDQMRGRDGGCEMDKVDEEEDKK